MVGPINLAVILWLALMQAPVFSAEVWKKDRPTNPLIKALGLHRFAEATGSKMFLIDNEWIPPESPTKVPGTVLHYDADTSKDSDDRYVIGDYNPIVHWEQLKKALYGRLDKEGIKDLNDKWDESRFLNLVSPELAPPETHLLSEFTSKTLPADQMAAIAKEADTVMAKFHLTDPEMKAKLIRLEVYRQNIQSIGRSILKERVSCHSEGRLPISDKNWMEMYAGYHAVTRPEMERIAKETEYGGGSYKDLIVRLPYFEGKVLEAVLTNPNDVVTQKMLKIHREVRVHIVDGKLLHPNASFLRFYRLNEYLPENERELIYKTVNDQFLSQLSKKLGPQFKKMYASADVVITEDGEIRIIDFNEGFDSGYYLERNDLFTANYLSLFYNGGKRTPLLEEYHQMDQEPIGDVSARQMERMHNKYRPFLLGLWKKDRKNIDEEVDRAFWDRMIISYVKKLERNSTPETFDRALADFRQAGLRNPNVYLQFLSQVQDTVTEKGTQNPLRLDSDKLAFWQKYISERAPLLNILVDGNRIYGEHKTEEALTAICKQNLAKIGG